VGGIAKVTGDERDDVEAEIGEERERNAGENL
jgi:hypothetical protein